MAEGPAEELRRAQQADPLGHRVHLTLALVYVFLLALSTAPKDVAFALLLGCAVVRLGRTWRCYQALIRDRLCWLLVAWTAWHALSMAWSPDKLQGLDELRAHRFILSILAIWPVVGDVVAIILAFLLGVLAQNLVQGAQLLGWMGAERGVDDRLRGLLHPIQTGTICVVALCWYGSGVLRAIGRTTIAVLLAGGLLAGAGLLLSGSRGPWVAAAIVLPAMVARIAWTRRASRRRAVLVLVGILIAAGASWPISGPFVGRRVAQAREDLRTAANGQYVSDVGRRVASWIAAGRLFRASPLIGVGAGGFEQASSKTDLAPYLAGAQHAHSMYMHVLACTGLIGIALVGAIAVLAVRRAWRAPPTCIFADGTVWALLAWLIGAAFDAYQLAGQMFGLLALLITMTIPASDDDLAIPCARTSKQDGPRGGGSSPWRRASH